jgi:DNA primase
VIGFGARILKNDKTQAKYLNSPESAIYHKSKILYGLFQSKQGIRKNDECFLVEGYTDVISLHQADVDNVVASSGTSLTEDQIRLIKRYTSNITVLYDGDAAGIKASIRGIDLILEQDMNVSVVLFPDGEDPDSYVKKIGPAAFIEYIKANKENFITFKTKLALKEANNDPFKRAEVIKDIIESISKIPDGIKRAVFFKECSTLLAIDEQTLITEYNKKLQANKSKASKDAHFSEREIEEVQLPSEFYEENSLPLEEQSLQLHERDVLKYLINHLTDKVENDTSLVTYMLNELLDIEFKNPVYARIMQEIKTMHEQGISIQESFFIQHNDFEIKKTVIDLLSNKYTISENWSNFHIVVPKDADILNSIVPKTILRFKRVLLKCLIKDNLKEIDRIQKSGNEEELVQALKVAIELKMLSKEVDKMLGIVVG